MDRYKHNAATQRSQRVKCAPNPILMEKPDDSTEKPTANGTGMLAAINSDIFLPIILFLISFVLCVSEAEHRNNNNKPFSNGTCSSVFLHSPGLSSPLSLACDFR